MAIQSLHGMELGDKKLIVQRASVGAKPGMNLPPEAYAAAAAIAEIPKPILPAGDMSEGDARILLMLNMVVTEDLADDQEYAEIYEDIKEECSTFGPVLDLRIPRPTKKDRKWGDAGSVREAQMIDEANGVGRVYVKYAGAESAQQALNTLAGRSFAGRSIVATLLTDDSQTTPPLNLIFAPQPSEPSAPPPPAPE